MIHYAAAHARQIQREPDTFWLSRHRKGPGMRYVNSIFGELLKPIDRRQFREIVERHNGNAYDKTFKSWDHLVTMVGAQLGGVASLRAVEATFKANSHQHYHLGVSKVPRSTLSRANARRPVGVFAETFAMLAKSFGIYGEGPILDPEEIRPALERGLKVVKEKRAPALIDTVTQSR